MRIYFAGHPGSDSPRGQIKSDTKGLPVYRYYVGKFNMMKILYGFLGIFFFLIMAGCDLDYEDCPVNCTTKVTDPNGHVIECHCPNN